LSIALEAIEDSTMSSARILLMDLASRLREHGFVVIPNAMTPLEIEALNAAIDADIAENPKEWVWFSESFIQTVDILPRRTDFDRVIEHPASLDLLQKVIGPDVTFEEFSIIIRNPTAEGSDHKSWHRDIVRSFDRRFEIDAISAIYHLTDVTEADHCFSIIPGTHDRLADLRPEDVRPGMEVDLIAPAGSIILFHARCLHSGKLKPNSRQRRTLHLYYSRSTGPRTSEWSTIPERLYRTGNPLYSKYKRTDVIDGTGRKPFDLDCAMSTAEMLREVQRRANSRA
jgi:ectoine hydroxylase-related dioxygenase (phytanoyl-CoA dioxygenase family)